MNQHKKINYSNLFQSYGTIIAGLMVILVFSLLRPDAFFTVRNLINISRQISLQVIIAIGATLIMAVGEFDLSIGALASLGGVIAAKMSVAGVPLVFCFLAPIVICFVIGWINGWIVTKFNVLSFVTTLGMSTILAGFTFWITGGSTVFQDIPKTFSYIGSKNLLSIPYLSIIMLVFTFIFWFVMRHMTFGRKLYAIGGNVTAANVSGIHVQKNKKLAFAICGSMSAITGVLMASRLGSAHPTGGDSFFLPSYAAVYLGSTVFKEGIPNIWGTFVGAAILGILANGLTILQVPTYIQDILTGTIIIFAVIAQKIGRGAAK
ncbi:MAG: ABC transporter permease [Flexilinea flocculi]|jgi:ribose transport system permease protein|nr:ABC transporter permease [Flexilinea flocculi]